MAITATSATGFAFFRLLMPGSVIQITCMVLAWYFYRRIWRGRIRTDLAKEADLVPAKQGGAALKQRIQEIEVLEAAASSPGERQRLADRLDHIRRTAAAFRKGKPVPRPARPWLIGSTAAMVVFTGLVFLVRPTAVAEILHPRPGDELAGLYERGEYDGVLAAASAAGLEDVGSIYNVGLAHFRKGELDAAAESFANTLEINPYYVDAHYNLGEIHRQRGELDSAAERFRKCLEIDAGVADAHYSLGVVLMEKRAFAEAGRSFDAAGRLYPSGSEWAARAREMAAEARSKAR